jgi:glutamyl-tRNA synthetase
LLTGAAGEGLSKRTGSASLADLRAGGIEAMAVNALLARLGSADPVEPATELGPLAARFDLSRFGRAPARFDADELAALNARVLHAMAFAQVEGRLPQGATAEFWLAVRGNIRRISDAAEWWSVINEPIQPVIDDQAFAAQAAELLPAGPFDQSSWGSWTKALAAASGRQGKLLFQPLRLALTGRDRGPEMHNLLPLIGPERARARLSGNIA